MSYMRGETYIWSDGDHLHLWSRKGMDHWQTIEGYQGNPTASGVQIPEPLADEFAVMRFAELLRLGEAISAIERALSNWGGNFGCAALEHLAPRIREVSEASRDPYWKLRPAPATPDDELCKCAEISSLMLQPGIRSNPMSCASCGLEVAPERVGLSEQVADDIARWNSFHEAFFTLWLDSGEFESWAREQLERLDSPVNVRGLEIARRITESRRCYYWYFQDTGVDGWRPLESCPRCAADLGDEVVRWLSCEVCSIIVGN